MSFKNKSGIKPVEYHILYTLDKVEEKIGMIHVPDAIRDREERAGTKGTLIDVGPMAFEDWPDDQHPKPGDRIILTVRYAGGEIEGADGETYYLANDKDIAAIVDKEKE
uniref:Putative chaperonin n=1 Tax=viral metagenome TaxID=1070528 RepID=A0A6H1ZWN7_9ZZZZ